MQHAFCTLLCRHCRTTTWNCLISRFVEDVNTRQLLSFSFSWTPSVFQNSTPQKKFQHLTTCTRWKRREKVWSSATSLLSNVFVAVAVVVASRGVQRGSFKELQNHSTSITQSLKPYLFKLQLNLGSKFKQPELTSCYILQIRLRRFHVFLYYYL